MNTPDTEGTLKKSGDEAETLVWYVQHAQTTQDAVDHVRLMLTSRDTYWKERVRKSFDEWNQSTEDIQDWADREFPPITNEDNLK